jgi:hypothetical protein
VELLLLLLPPELVPAEREEDVLELLRDEEELVVAALASVASPVQHASRRRIGFEKGVEIMECSGCDPSC